MVDEEVDVGGAKQGVPVVDDLGLQFVGIAISRAYSKVFLQPVRAICQRGCYRAQ